MKYQLNKLSVALLLAFSAISCGGGGGSGGDSGGGTVTTPVDPGIETPTVTEAEIEAIEEQLIDSGLGNFDDYTDEEVEAGAGDFDDLSHTEVEAIEEALLPTYDDEQIEEIFDELGIVDPVVEVTEDTDATFVPDIIGLWELAASNGASGTLLSVGSKTITVYTPNVTDLCYDLSLNNIYAQVDNDITIQDLLTDELSVITVFNEGELTYEGTTFTESEVDTFASAPLCDSTLVQTVQVDIELQDLETQLKLTANSDPVSNYRWQIFFDTNDSGIYDSGDMNFLLNYNSISDTPNSDGYVNIDDSDPMLFFAYQADDSAISFLTNKSVATPDTSLVVGKSADIGSVTISGSTVTLIFDTSINPMMAYITGDTPIKVINLIRHDADDSDVYGDLTIADDGPWNWTSYEHKDEYPAGDFFASSSNGLVHTDPSDDLVSGEALWVDIETVTVSVTAQ